MAVLFGAFLAFPLGGAALGAAVQRTLPPRRIRRRQPRTTPPGPRTAVRPPPARLAVLVTATLVGLLAGTDLYGFLVTMMFSLLRKTNPGVGLPLFLLGFACCALLLPIGGGALGLATGRALIRIGRKPTPTGTD